MEFSDCTEQQLDRVKRIWYLSPMRAAKVQASLRIRTVSPEPSLLAHASSESRGTFRQKARSLAPLNGWACPVKVCHDGMLEDTNSLDAPQLLILFLAYPSLESKFKAWKMYYFINYMLKYRDFLERNRQFRSYRQGWRSFWCKMTSKDVPKWCQRLLVLHKSCLIPEAGIIHFHALISCAEIPVGYAKTNTYYKLIWRAFSSDRWAKQVLKLKV